jgi:hypothetical protein
MRSPRCRWGPSSKSLGNARKASRRNTEKLSKERRFSLSNSTRRKSFNQYYSPAPALLPFRYPSDAQLAFTLEIL